MSPDEFRISLAIRYPIPPKGLPAICDGCGEDFSMNHALNCKKGGLVTARHNEARDLNCDLCALAGLSQIVSAPIQPMKLLDLGLIGLFEVFGNTKELRCSISAFSMLTLILCASYLSNQSFRHVTITRNKNIVL